MGLFFVHHRAFYFLLFFRNRSDNFNFTWEGFSTTSCMNSLFFNPDSYRSLKTSDAWWAYMWDDRRAHHLANDRNVLHRDRVWGAFLDSVYLLLSGPQHRPQAYIYQPVQNHLRFSPNRSRP
jgi:hypothetical protein